MAIELTDKITPKNAAFTDIVDAKNVGGDGTSSNALQADVVANNAANKVLRVHSGNSYVEAATLTAGTNVTITHGTGTITIASSGGGGTGDVTGPSSSTAGQVPYFSDATGKVITNSGITVTGATSPKNDLTSSSGTLTFNTVSAKNGYFGDGTGFNALIGYDGVVSSNGYGIILNGLTSGTIVIKPGANAAGSYTLKLPTSMPSATDYYLKTTGTTGETGWATIPSMTPYTTLVRLTADETAYNNNATLTQVTGFNFTASASKKYRVHGLIIVSQGTATPNFKFAFDTPGAGVATVNVFANNSNEGAGAQRTAIATADNTGVTISEPSGTNYVSITGFIVTGASSGTIAFYGAQGTATATNTQIKAGSFLFYEEVN